jgi:hypothetical protein
VNARLLGTVWCHEIVAGERLHHCGETAEPHQIRVCITRADNEALFDQLVDRMVEGASRDAV